ncbi:MAG: AMP-binding protein [Cyanobacteriota bacterium]|nr:AMP-binding protein [Cyanobacteriota bacterium]
MPIAPASHAPAGAPRAEIQWTGSPEDGAALARRDPWRGVDGLERLWPVLAERHGEAIALEDTHASPPIRLSYRALGEEIARAAAAFAALGVAPGDVVALFAENSPRWLISDQGLMRAGAADAVRGGGAPVEELRYILDDCGAAGLVVESAALFRKLEPRPDQLARLRFVLCLEGEAAARADGGTSLSWEDLRRRGATAPTPPVPTGGEGRLATLLYTSGTTGQPKGVPLTHANLLHQIRHLGVAVAPSPGDRVLSVLPIWHAYERTAEYFLLSCGCQQTYTSLRHLKADLRAVRPQYMISVPRLWEALLSGFEDALAAMPEARRTLLTRALANSRAHQRARRTARDLTLAPEPASRRLAAGLEALLRAPLHSLASALLWPKVRDQLVGGELRTAISGGGALAIHVDGFFEAIGIELLVGYGLTETSPVLTCRRPWRNRRGSAGQPLPGTALRVVRPENRQAVAIGEPGLVLARGPQVMAGYHGKPEATAKVLDSEGWFDTGDLGRLLADGSLVLTGRAKDTIVLSSGENIEPGPLEEALVESPLIEQVMLVGQDRKQLGALLVPRAEPLTQWARGQGLPEPTLTPEGAVAGLEPALAKALTRDCNRLLAARPGSRPDERLVGLAPVEPFTIDNGLLTQTLKQRRDRIAARDAAAIASLYGEE